MNALGKVLSEQFAREAREHAERVTAPKPTYAIVEDGHLMDGETHDRASLFRALPYAGASAKVMAIDLAEFIRDGATTVRDVTEDMVQAAYDAGHLTREDALVWALLDLPETADEAAGNAADAAWHGGVRMSKEQTLKPCPLCGAALIFWPGSSSYAHPKVTSADCVLHTIGIHQADAVRITAWNRRPIEDALVEALEDIARQRTTSEAYDEEDGDWEGAFDLCVQRARAALSLTKGAE